MMTVFDFIILVIIAIESSKCIGNSVMLFRVSKVTTTTDFCDINDTSLSFV